MEDDDDRALIAEFDTLAGRAGLFIPEDRRELLFASFKDLRRMAQLMRPLAGASLEPATVYSILTVARSLPR